METITKEILLAGTAIILAILVKHGFLKTRVSPIVGYLVLGFLLRLSAQYWDFLTVEVRGVFEFLAHIGLVALLFRIGLESNLAGLIRQLRYASIVWIGDVFVSGVLGFFVPYYLLSIPLIPSLFIGTAFTATSIGVSVAIWQELNALNSPNGGLLVDVAEMDDISGVLLMSLLLAVVPILRGSTGASLPFVIGKTSGMFFLKAILFGAFCIVFSRYAEERITRFFRKIKPAPDQMLLIAGIGFVIAALANWLGFSVAVGALFAGLVFSRDPDAVKIDASFGSLFEFFTPFFFINIGLKIDPDSLVAALSLGMVLLALAVVTKTIGHGAPLFFMKGWKSAVLLGVSMIPRAEIAMVIMQQGRKLGDWAVPPYVFSAMVLVSAATCIISPLFLRSLLIRWPQKEKET
ncbi:MAG: cation:proton antiporter [wastewater metagenome]|nr:cation:proton antiporter [Candidatus Loosdrechtia aerotolerans]